LELALSRIETGVQLFAGRLFVVTLEESPGAEAMVKASRVLFGFVMIVIAMLSALSASAQTTAKEGYIDAGNGVKLYYRLVGSGSEPVVLIHGGPGLTSDYLADDLTAMARNHSLLVYDQRGIGRSTLVSDSSALAAQRYVEDLEAIRKHLELERLTLLGHSWGVAPAALYAMQYPERVRRMILVGTIPPERSGLVRAFQTVAAARDSATLRRMTELSRIRAANPDDLAACREYYQLWFTPFFGTSTAASRMKGNVCAGSPESLKNKRNVDKYTFASLGNWDWTTSLGKVVVPTLIIQGELDPLPIESARKWAAAMPNARLLELKGIGHFPYVETPEVFFAAVDRFLRGDWPEGAVR
jgi:proline iminopeptidase